jgi:limonene-1,2-epoxide hydrolase
MSNEDVVKKFFSCYQQHDFKGMHSCLDENIKFSDFAYDIQGDQVKAMWHLFCISYLPRKKPVDIPEFKIIEIAGNTVLAKYRVSYLYGEKERPVDYWIEAYFKIKDNKICEQQDEFDSVSTFGFVEMALGFPYQLIAIKPLDQILRVLINKKVMKKLNKFMEEQKC